MKFEINQQDFLKGINNVQRAISKKKTIPVLTGIFLEADKNKGLHLIATNLDLGIECWLNNVEIKTPGKTILPGNHIYNIIRELPTEKINITLNQEKMQIDISCMNSFFTLNCFNPDEFPQLPQIEKSQEFNIPAIQFKNFIDEVKFSISQNQSQPGLTGALFVIEDNCLKIIATNTYRLAYNKIVLEKSLTQNSEINNIIIPGNTLNELSNLLPNSESEIKIIVDSNHIHFTFENLAIISRLIEGDFPNYQQVIPDEFNTTLEINTKKLINALKRVSLIARLNSNEILLTIKENKLILETTETETGKANEKINIVKKGPDQNIKIDAGYLLDALKIIHKEKVKLKLIGSINPLTIKNKENNKEFIYLVMPIRQD